jgi:hypothetical protein
MDGRMDGRNERPYVMRSESIAPFGANAQKGKRNEGKKRNKNYLMYLWVYAAVERQAGK